MSIRQGLILLAFMAFSIGVFFVTSIFWLSFIVFALVMLLFVCELNFMKLLRLIGLLLPIISVSLAFNYLINRDFDLVLIVFLRLLAISIASFIYSNTISTMKFISGLMFILQPLRLLRVRIRDIAVAIAIAIAFIPILRNEYIKIKQGMHAKAKRRGVRILLGIVLYKVLYRAGQLSRTLDAKGYS